jgi:serine/threonine protein kinase
MTTPQSKLLSTVLLSDLLAQQHPWSLQERLGLVKKLAVAVRALHEGGQTHRDICPEMVGMEDPLQPRLMPPAAPREFGGAASDPEFCPPELAGNDPLEVPSDLESAGAVLQKAHGGFNPRRIDVYQLGVLLCRLLTGESIRAYMLSPTTKARVPRPARSVLAGALGENTGGRLETCEELLLGLAEAIRLAEKAEVPSWMQETPATGTASPPLADTPPRGIRRAGPPPIEADLPFDHLGHFQIVQRIGHGGMGDVYKGYEPSLDRYVAIKVLPAELARDADFVRRFHAEATAVAKITHPNVVPIYFIGEDAGHHFFAMQFIAGQSLAQRLAEQHRLPPAEAVEIVSQCLAGLEAAHAQGLVHRDVKPGNVLLDGDANRAVLVDFGLVRQIGQAAQMTATGVVMGTVDYIAPEQARGQAVDGRADIYALGVMLYQLLAGRLPFVADSATAMIFQHAFEEPFPLEQAAPDAPSPLVAIIRRMMAKDPAERYPTCAAVLAALRAQGGEEDAAAAEPRSEPAEPLVSDVRREMDSALPATIPSAKLGTPENPWRRAKDWAATLFRRHAPEFLQELQGTTQQVDGAVAEYERRCQRLRTSLAEARSIAGELATQIRSNEAAWRQAKAAAAAAPDRESLDAKQQACEEDLAGLRSQHDEQQRRIGQLESELVKAEATLVQLRSQRDLLAARLKAAQARQRMEGLEPSQRRWNPRAATIAGAAIAAAVLLMIVAGVWHKSPLLVPDSVVTAPPVEDLPADLPAPSPSGTWGKLVTIQASAPDGLALGRIPRNTVVRLQYASGKWKAWGRISTVYPDRVETPGGDKSRLVLAAAAGPGGPGKVLQMVPVGTAQTPFVWRADSDYDAVVLRINDVSAGKRPGSVQYRMEIIPPQIAAAAPADAEDRDAQLMIAQLPDQQFATVRILSEVAMAPLETGAKIFADREFAWGDIPAYMKRWNYSRGGSHQGSVEFAVQRPGIMMLGVTPRWGGGGNSEGEWKGKVTTQKELLAQGWKPLGSLSCVDPNISHWLVFWRPCTAGESFSLRTEKYAAPILFLPKGSAIQDARP